VGRTVTALVTMDEEYLGAIGPFAADVPWWSEVEPVVARLCRMLEVPVLVLRLLRVDGGAGARDGHVTFHVEALRRPASGLLSRRGADLAELTGTHPLRSPWARAGGVRELLDWAADTLAAADRPVTGPVVQRKTWNLAGLFRLPTDRGPVWLKATPHFATDEAVAIATLARPAPDLVPTVIAHAPGRILLEHLPGEDCWDAPAAIIASGVTRMVAAQAELAGLAGAATGSLPDRRGPVLAPLVGQLLDGEAGAELTAGELAAARALVDRWSELDGCGLPDTVVHGDFHSGNWRSDGGPPVLVDFADVHLGSPILDGVRVCDFLPAAKRPAAARAWIDAWVARVPGSAPERALTIGEPFAHLTYAVRYQEFLDGIEPSERIYHLGDPAASIRAALRCVPAAG
jgi:hypothetical protein